MSYKEEFNKWKSQREAEGKKFYDKLSDIFPNTDNDLKVGDKVMFTNDYGVTFGPAEVLAFSPHVYGRVVYWDNSAYWFPARPDQLTKV